MGKFLVTLYFIYIYTCCVAMVLLQRKLNQILFYLKTVQNHQYMWTLNTVHKLQLQILCNKKTLTEYFPEEFLCLQ